MHYEKNIFFIAEDHAVGLSTFTIMAGLGGSLGYAMGAVNWGSLDVLFGGHVRLVFTLVLGIFIACVNSTLTSFAEIPLDVLASSQVRTLMRWFMRLSHKVDDLLGIW